MGVHRGYESPEYSSICEEAMTKRQCEKCCSNDILVKYYDKGDKDEIKEPTKRHDAFCNRLYIQFTRECLFLHCRVCQYYWFVAPGKDREVLNKPYKEVTW